MAARRQPPTPDWFSAWTELRGYVAQAVEDGGPVDAGTLAAYMDELKRGVMAPVRKWMDSLGEAARRQQDGGQDG